MKRTRKDPYKDFNYRLHLGDDPATVIAGFAEVSGLQKQKPARTREAKPLTITLRRGLVSAASMPALTQTSKAFPCRQLTVTLYNESQQAVGRWQLVNPVPGKWTGPSLAAASNDVTVEEIEITADGIHIADTQSE